MRKIQQNWRFTYLRGPHLAVDPRADANEKAQIKEGRDFLNEEPKSECYQPYTYPLSASWIRIDGFRGSQGALSVRGLCGEWGAADSYIKVARRSPANRRVQSVSNFFNTFHEPYS